jgi:hypothetical protein
MNNGRCIFLLCREKRVHGLFQALHRGIRFELYSSDNSPTAEVWTSYILILYHLETLRATVTLTSTPFYY